MKLYTIKALIKNFSKNKKAYSFHVAFAKFLKDLPMSYVRAQKVKKYNSKCNYRYIKKKYNKRIKDLQARLYCEKSKRVEEKAPKTIWVMWWQGVEGMPPIVQACYRQLLKVKKDWEVVLITKENWAEYVSFPEYIINKVESGTISLTHFSDLMRVALLSEYGGAWFDATIYTTKLPVELERDKFFTLHTDRQMKDFISEGLWTGFLLYCPYKRMQFPVLLKHLYELYFLEHDELIEYFLMDLFIKLLYESVEEIKTSIDNCPIQIGYDLLLCKLNEKYSSEAFKGNFHKLSYKFDFEMETPQGEKTNYAYLLE